MNFRWNLPMYRIVTVNANGIRSAHKKGLLEWFLASDADVLCMQEVRAGADDVPAVWAEIPGYHAYFHPAEKKGYSGCALWCREEPREVRTGFGGEFDAEGRFVEADFGTHIVMSAYFPSGTSGDERQAAKYRFLDQFLDYVERRRAEGREIVFCGDVNIAHKEIDLKNWKGNMKNSGFLPEERAWMTKLLSEHDWRDVFRLLDPRPDQYTWWSQRGQARAKNVGWRIDYQIATPLLASCARATSIYKDEKFSDHAPLTVDYDLGALTAGGR